MKGCCGMSGATMRWATAGAPRNDGTEFASGPSGIGTGGVPAVAARASIRAAKMAAPRGTLLGTLRPLRGQFPPSRDCDSRREVTRSVRRLRYGRADGGRRRLRLAHEQPGTVGLGRRRWIAGELRRGVGTPDAGAEEESHGDPSLRRFAERVGADPPRRDLVRLDRHRPHRASAGHTRAAEAVALRTGARPEVAPAPGVEAVELLVVRPACRVVEEERAGRRRLGRIGGAEPRRRYDPIRRRI